MKGKVLWISLACLVVIGGLLAFTLTWKTIDLDGAETGIAQYVYGGKNIKAEIAKEDIKVITEILDGKSMHLYLFGTPSCGFDENVAVIIGGKTFCIARDSCGTVLCKGKGYIELDSKENETLRTTLEKYGFSWPCI